MTAVFTTTYLEGTDPTGSDRLERTVKWFNYMKGLQSSLGFTDLLATDNGSPWELLHELSKRTGARIIDETLHECVYVGDPSSRIIVTRHNQHLTKTGKTLFGDHDYPYVWRGLYDMAQIARTCSYDKIIRVDNDAYVLSQRLATYLRELQTGWIALGLKGYVHQYPEDAISVICRDSYHLLTDFCSVPMEGYFGRWFERVLPFTQICEQFVGDRYGNYAKPPEQRDEMDFYCQCPVPIKMTFEQDLGGDHGF